MKSGYAPDMHNVVHYSKSVFVKPRDMCVNNTLDQLFGCEFASDGSDYRY